MTRRRSSAPGRDRPDRRRSFLVLAALLALVLSACGGPTASPSGSGTAGPDASAESTSSPSAAATADATDVASVASAVDWPVYCPALPAGWLVQSGSYRLAGGARLEISYRGPRGAHIDLKEGAFCSSSDGCVPDGTDAGTAAFGDRQGSLVSVGPDSWAISDDAGSTPSWLLSGTGLSEDEFRTIASDLVVVGG